MRRLAVLVTTIVLPLLAIGQKPTLPQLKEQLQQAATNNERGFAQCELSLAYSGIDSIKTFAYAQQALTTFQRSNNPYGVGQSYLALGGGYFDYNNLEQAINYYTLAKAQFAKLLQQDSSVQYMKGWTKSTINLSATLGRQGRSEEELRYMMEAEPVAERAGDSYILALINSNLGITFTNREAYRKAHAYFTRSGQLYEDTTSTQFVQDRLIFSFCLYELDSLTAMRKVLDRIEQILKRTPQSVDWHLYYLARGKYLLGKEEYQAAIHYYDRARTLVEESKMIGYLDAIFRHYAEVYDAMGNNASAKQYTLRYLECARQDQNPENELSALEELVKYEAREGNYEQAYAQLDYYVRLRDSVDLSTNQARFNELELRYQSEKKEKEIVELERRNGEVALALEKKRSQQYLTLLIAGSLALVLLVGYGAYRHQRDRAQTAEQQRADEVRQLKHEQQARITSALMEGQEKERKRLATDLHDGLGGRLSGISLKLSKLNQDRRNGSADPQIEEIMENLNGSLVELRGIARNLTPETLSRYGLKAALEDYCSSLDRPDTRVILQCYGPDDDLQESTRLTIYRIIQELINNAVKHAQASEILVQYMRAEGTIHITVEDDGVGFEPSDQSAGMGLTNIKNRVAYLNGTMELHTSSAEGTTVTIHLHG
ncbi:MAG: ATP-binding protein [Tunicatimonas sp.]